MAEERVTLAEAIEMARALDCADKLKLREELDQMIVTPREPGLRTQANEMDFRLQLLKSGLITDMRLGQKKTEYHQKFVPVPVKGKPVSRTIIEDRR